MFKKLFVSFLICCLFVCGSANAISSTCNSSISVVSAKADPSGAGYVYTLTLSNTGSTSISSKITSYSSSGASYSSSASKAIAGGKTVTISVPFNSCYSYIKLENSQTIKKGGSTSTSTCSTTIAVSGAAGYCNCGCCPTKPTPTPSTPVCDAGGPYTGDNIICSKTPVAVKLDGSKSKDPSGKPVQYSWSSNCPAANFNSTSAASPVLSLITASTPGSSPSISCNVNLTVTNQYGKSASCSSLLAAKPCNYDCAGVLNGSAVIDRCGVCNGDGSSCVDCDSVNITGNQLALDSNANALRDNVLKINKQLKAGASNAKLSSTQLRAETDYISSSNSEAQLQYIQAWQTIYTGIPGAIISCTNSFCVNVSNAGYKASVNENSNDLYKLAQKSYKRLLKVEKTAKKNKSSKLKKVQAAVKKARNIFENSAKLYNLDKQELSKIPANQSSC